MARRFLWMVGIYAASVLALGVIALAMRLLMQAAGLGV